MQLTDEQYGCLAELIEESNSVRCRVWGDSTTEVTSEIMTFFKQEGFIDDRGNFTLNAYNSIKYKDSHEFSIIREGVRLLKISGYTYYDIYMFVDGFLLLTAQKCKCRVQIAQLINAESLLEVDLQIIPEVDLNLYKKIKDLEEKQRQEMVALTTQEVGYFPAEYEYINVDWKSLINGLPITGLLKQLAIHCVFKKQADKTIFLTLPPQQEPLRKQVDKLQTAFQETYGKQWKLDIRIES